MYHYRVDLTGPPAAARAVAAEIGQAGVGTTLIVARDEGIDFWESLSIRHAKVTFGIECFEAFEDELLHAVIQDGETTVMAREGVLPSDLGSYHEEDGDPIGDDLLRAAAEWIAEQRLRHDVGTLESGLATALTWGEALGRLCSRVERTAYGDASPEGLDAVVELAVFALWTSTARSNTGPREREYDHALRLTQSMVHAGRSEFWDAPGDADWSEWLQVLIGSASHVIETATHVRIEPENDLHALGSEHYRSPEEHLELATRSLLTTCIQTLAMFGEAHRSRV
jgi:hypothetical protein